jgi:large subunit ribosomal protein L27e
MDKQGIWQVGSLLAIGTPRELCGLKTFTLKMIFVPNMIVIPLRGKNAGKKAVVVKVLPEEGYVLTAVMVRVPIESKDSDEKWVKRRNAKFYVILKKYRTKHLLATRYKADIGLAGIQYDRVFDSVEEKRLATNMARDVMRKAREESKARFLFTELEF